MFALWAVLSAFYAAGAVVCVMHLDLDTEDCDERAYQLLVLAWPLTLFLYAVHRARWRR